MLNKYQFKIMLRDYAVVSGTEITNHAMDYAYLELLQGRKTALIENMEAFKRRVKEESKKKILKKEEELEERKIIAKTKRQPKNKGTYSGMNYLNPRLFQYVLDPSLNKPVKKDTYVLASEMGKRYVIYNCSFHGSAMYRATTSRKTSVFTGESKYRFDGYCLVCRYERQIIDEEKAKDVRAFHDNYMKHREEQAKIENDQPAS